MGLTIIVVYHTFPFPGCLFTYAEKQSKKNHVIIEYAITLWQKCVISANINFADFISGVLFMSTVR